MCALTRKLLRDYLSNVDVMWRRCYCCRQGTWLMNASEFWRRAARRRNCHSLTSPKRQLCTDTLDSSRIRPVHSQRLALSSSHQHRIDHVPPLPRVPVRSCWKHSSEHRANVDETCIIGLDLLACIRACINVVKATLQKRDREDSGLNLWRKPANWQCSGTD